MAQRILTGASITASRERLQRRTQELRDAAVALVARVSERAQGHIPQPAIDLDRWLGDALNQHIVARVPASLRLRLAHVAAIALVALALVIAYWWSWEYLPGRYRTMWSPYFFGPMGWVAAAGLAFVVYRRLGRQAPAMAIGVNRRTVLGIAVLIGCFLVAVQVVLGMLTSFGTSPFAHSPKWLAINALFFGAPLVAGELARCAILRTWGTRMMMVALMATSLGLALIPFNPTQLSDAFLLSGAPVDQIEFWGAAILPAAALGLLAGFFAMYGGPWASLSITLPTATFTYFSPFLPVAEWPMVALAGIAGPALGLWIADGLLLSEDDSSDDSEGWWILRVPSIGWIVTLTLSLGMYWFSFGFLGYEPAFVPSHSMEPLLHQGDLVIMKNIDPDDIKVGDIVAYRTPNSGLVLHRVIEIQDGTAAQGEGETVPATSDPEAEGSARYFILQGDNNNTADVLPVTEDQIEAEYLFHIPKLGWVPFRFSQLIQELR